MEQNERRRNDMNNGGIWGGGGKKLKTKISYKQGKKWSNHVFSTEKEAQKSTPTKDGKQNCTTQSGNQENLRET